MFKKKKDDYVNPFADDDILGLNLEDSTVMDGGMPGTNSSDAATENVGQVPPTEMMAGEQSPMPTAEEVDTAIKKAEASTALPAEDMLESGEPKMMNPEPAPVMAPINPDKETGIGPEPPENKTSAIGVEAVSTGNEFDDLLAWGERDTIVKIDKVQKVIDGLEARINNIVRELESDTEGLSEDAKSLFDKNTKKNISLIRDQIAREKELQEVLNTKKDTFVSKLKAALGDYDKPVTVSEFKLRDDDGKGYTKSDNKDSNIDTK